MKPDDASLPREQLDAVRRHADRLLRDAGAFGVFPTPVDRVMAAARVEMGPDTLDEGFLDGCRRKFGAALRRALSKVRGVVDAVARVIYVDRTLLVVKQTYLKVHEIAHVYLPWQRKLYSAFEDCDKTLHPDVAEAFDREANAFASEVLFQCDAFAAEAADLPLRIWTPVRLSKTYGASVYATVRRYVRTHHRACAVLVYDPPVLIEGDGFQASLRRVEASEEFVRSLGRVDWPQTLTPDHPLGGLIPVGRRASRPRNVAVAAADGSRHECVAEAFTQGYQVFVLLCPARRLAKTTVIAP